MSRRRRAPLRQPRGPRATLPSGKPLPPCGVEQYPEIGLGKSSHDLNHCPCWHLYDECPCLREDHMEAHLAADCGCTAPKES